MSSKIRTGLLLAASVYFLFFFGLTDVGMLGPDEPRYASIGREIARSGDWVTPRLWGKPWFEKPALLYWMIAAANKAGLGEDLAPRLPVALLNVLFLLLFYGLLRGEFGRRPALFSTLILGTSAMWLAFSQLGVTDLPMAATYCVAMLCGLRWFSTGHRKWLTVAAIFLALSVLAKGLVPLVLALPMLWLGRKRWKELVSPVPLAAFFLVAGPWYLLCTLRNGSAFLDEFFWRHHFERFATGALLHRQPFWFYLPILLAGIFPWTPLLAPLFRRRFYEDQRRGFLLLWVLFGFLFFSAATNKLPGYLLPLFPAVAILAGLALDEMKDARWVLASACLLLLLVPVVADSLPRILMAGGLSRATLTGWSWGFAITYCSLAGVVWWWEEAGRREGAAALVLLGVVLGVTYLKVKSYPSLDRLASARPLWQRIVLKAPATCVGNIHRNWRYGLNYYSITPLPNCSDKPRPVQIQQFPGHPPSVLF